jgi:hypothetical protein
MPQPEISAPTCLEQPGLLGVATHTPMNRENIIQSICFAGLLAMFCVLSIHACLFSRETLSEQENRALADFPKIHTWKKDLPKFPTAFEPYFKTIFHLDWLSFVQGTWLPLKFSTRLATHWWLSENKTGYSINLMVSLPHNLISNHLRKTSCMIGRKTSSSEIHF